MAELTTENIKDKHHHTFTAWILLVCFVISLAAFIFYYIDLQYDDSTLYILLSVLRYSSFLVFICSLYKLFIHFYRLIKKYQRLNPFKMLIFLILAAYGISLFLFESAVVVVSGGNL